MSRNLGGRRGVFRIEGLKELDAALGLLKKAAGKRLLRKVLMKAAGPMADTAQRLAPVDTGILRKSTVAGTKLTRRQARLARKAMGSQRVRQADGSFRTAGPATGVEVHVGPSGGPRSIVSEFGSSDTPAQPFMRPAFDAHKNTSLASIGADLTVEIERAAARAARKAARQIAKVT